MKPINDAVTPRITPTELLNLFFFLVIKRLYSIMCAMRPFDYQIEDEYSLQICDDQNLFINLFASFSVKWKNEKSLSSLSPESQVTAVIVDPTINNHKRVHCKGEWVRFWIFCTPNHPLIIKNFSCPASVDSYSYIFHLKTK